jgi:SAM-dependent methyltransferase
VVKLPANNGFASGFRGIFLVRSAAGARSPEIVSESTTNKSAAESRGPTPLGWDLFVAPEAVWPWLTELRAQKIQPFVTYADAVLDFGADAGWNIAGVNCKRKVACWADALNRSKAVEVERVRALAELPSESIDIILSHHSLGLLLDPHAAIVELRSKLKPGGRLLIFAPAETERSLRSLRAAESSRWHFTWTVQTLANLVEQSGYEYLEGEVTRWGSEVFAMRQLLRFGGGERAFRFWRKFGWWFEPFREIGVVATIG